MTHVTNKMVVFCVLIAGLYSCNGNNTSNYTRCEDSLAMYTRTAAKSGDTVNMAAASGNEGPVWSTYPNDTGDVYATDVTENTSKESGKAHKVVKRKGGYNSASAMSMEPSGPGRLVVTSPAFGNNGVIPVKYTCDGQGATPPLNVTNIPPGTKSLTLIVHDYNATPEGGMTYWLIWNLDTLGVIPENFRNSHEGMNAAHEYGNTPLCAKSGNHKYHFIVYAVDTRLVIGKNSTKSQVERVMKDHILAKGELVGVYNRQLE